MDEPKGSGVAESGAKRDPDRVNRFVVTLRVDTSRSSAHVLGQLLDLFGAQASHVRVRWDQAPLATYDKPKA